jgi:3-oxoacyl-ACP reductase-like protein
MGIFSNILSKLGFGDKKEETAAQAPASQPAPTAPAATAAVPVPAANTAPVATPVPLPTPAISEVDVVAQLTAMAAASREKLNWKISIVDLLKLLGLDSSLTARKELATELGCPAEKMADSAQMNMWLHKTVLRKLADNGGNIPADLLD